MRPFEFLAKPCSVAYDKYARSQELAKKRQNLIKILPFWEKLIFKHPKGCFFISIPCNALYVILSENMGTPRDTVYPWGKGVCKHKTGDCRLRRLTGQQRSIRRVRIPRKGTILQTHARYCCTCVEKKAHTSKRVSVIARDNVISKAKLCDAYTRIFQNLQRTPKIHQILAVLERVNI